MATYHCSIKNGKTGNAKRHCEYILREGSYANGPKKEELVYKQFGNLPDWSAKPTDFLRQQICMNVKMATLTRNLKLHCRRN